MPGPLTNPRWEQFCRLRVYEGLTCVEAYKRAGFVGNPAHQAEKVSAKPAVRARIQEMQAELHQKYQQKQLYDRDFVVKTLLQNIDESRQGIQTYQGQVIYLRDPDGELVLDELGNPIPVRKMDHRAVNQAAELLGLELGMFPRMNKTELSKKDPFEGLTALEILTELRNSIAHELGWAPSMEDLQKLVNVADVEVVDVKRLPEP